MPKKFRPANYPKLVSSVKHIKGGYLVPHNPRKIRCHKCKSYTQWMYTTNLGLLPIEKIMNNKAYGGLYCKKCYDAMVRD